MYLSDYSPCYLHLTLQNELISSSGHGFYETVHIFREDTPLDWININLETFCITIYSYYQCFKVFITFIKLYNIEVKETSYHSKFMKLNCVQLNFYKWTFFICAPQPHHRMHVLLFPFYKWGNWGLGKSWISQVCTTIDLNAGAVILLILSGSIHGLDLSSHVIFSNNLPWHHCPPLPLLVSYCLAYCIVALALQHCSKIILWVCLFIASLKYVLCRPGPLFGSQCCPWHLLSGLTLLCPCD